MDLVVTVRLFEMPDDTDLEEVARIVRGEMNEEFYPEQARGITVVVDGCR